MNEHITQEELDFLRATHQAMQETQEQMRKLGRDLQKFMDSLGEKYHLVQGAMVDQDGIIHRVVTVRGNGKGV